MKNTINWFEIPATDFDRARRFYSTIFNVKLHEETVMGIQSAIFPGDGEESANGAIVFGGDYAPSTKGCVVYLNADGQLDTVLGRIEAAGGKVLQPATDIGFGFIAYFLDTEGNKVGLHTEP
jgi:predicted enzyme related to lactoylglutathione lyase